MKGVRPIAALAALLALAGLPTPLAGCLGCEPTLDVRHCLDASERCAPAETSAVIEWNATWAAAFPDVDRLLRETALGEHSHGVWNSSREAAWWQAAGIPLDQATKEAYVRFENGLYRIRVLTCP